MIETEDTIKLWRELMDKGGDLHPDLQGHVRNDGYLPTLHHPFLVEVPYFEAMNGLYNWRYENIKQAVEERFDKGDVEAALALCPRPYRLNHLLDYLDTWPTISPDKVGKAINYVWTDSENIWEMRVLWADLWVRHGRTLTPKQLSANAKDFEAYKKLPERVTVYRGFNVGRNFQQAVSQSWTLDRDKAEWFAHRFMKKGRGPRVMTGIVAKKDIRFYSGGRGESEVVVRSGTVGVTDISSLK